MWMLVALVAVHVAAFTIFFFEWLSPYGYDTKVRCKQKLSFFNRNFSGHLSITLEGRLERK